MTAGVMDVTAVTVALGTITFTANVHGAMTAHEVPH